MPFPKLHTTKETSEAISGIEKLLADECDISLKTVYGVLAGSDKDPFALFRWWFKRIARISYDRALVYYNALGGILEVEKRRQHIQDLPDSPESHLIRLSAHLIGTLSNSSSTQAEKCRAVNAVVDAAVGVSCGYTSGDLGNASDIQNYARANGIDKRAS